jgi:hypothetical protein
MHAPQLLPTLLRDADRARDQRFGLQHQVFAPGQKLLFGITPMRLCLKRNAVKGWNALWDATAKVRVRLSFLSERQTSLFSLPVVDVSARSTDHTKRMLRRNAGFGKILARVWVLADFWLVGCADGQILHRL